MHSASFVVFVHVTLAFCVLLAVYSNYGAWFRDFSGKQWRMWQKYIPGLPSLTGRGLRIYEALYRVAMFLVLVAMVYLYAL